MPMFMPVSSSFDNTRVGGSGGGEGDGLSLRNGEGTVF